MIVGPHRRPDECILCGAWQMSASSAQPATPGRRRSTACSDTRSSTSSRSAPTRSRDSPEAHSTRDSRTPACPAFVTNEAALAHEADVTIICLSHEAAAAIDVPLDGVVVDLSGAHRLRDASSYDAWYGFTHPRPEGLGDWVYGLPELVAGRAVDRQPRVLRDGGAARARADQGRDRAGLRRRRRACRG